MKIVSERTPPPQKPAPWPFDNSIIDCPHCHSEVAFEPHDMKSPAIKALTNKSTGVTVASFLCPICHTSVHIEHEPNAKTKKAPRMAEPGPEARIHGFVNH